MKNKIPQLNAGSMADIAFLLLVFFLLVTTISADKGILKILPSSNESSAVVIDRNVLEIQLNANDEILAEGNLVNEKGLRKLINDFYTNGGVFEAIEANMDMPLRRDLDPDDVSQASDTAMAIRLFGEFKVMPKSAVICLQYDNDVSYDRYISAMNLIEEVTNDLRDELSVRFLGSGFRGLEPNQEQDAEIIQAVKVVYPPCLSEYDLE